MSLLRTVLALAILAVLAYLGISYLGIAPGANRVTGAISALGELLVLPAGALLGALPLSDGQRSAVESGGIYSVGLAACALYFLLFLLLGVGRR